MAAETVEIVHRRSERNHGGLRGAFQDDEEKLSMIDPQEADGDMEPRINPLDGAFEGMSNDE